MAMVQNFVTYLVQSLQLKLLARSTNTALSRYRNVQNFFFLFLVIGLKFNTYIIGVFNKMDNFSFKGMCSLQARLVQLVKIGISIF